MMRELGGGTQQDLRRSNERLLLECLLDADPEAGLTRPELARRLELTPQAISKMVSNGLSWIRAGERHPDRTRESAGRGAGRPANVLLIPRDAGYVVGIELDHDRVRAVVADLRGQLVDSTDYEEQPVERDLHEGLEAATLKACELASAHGIQPEQLAGIGVSFPAPVNVTRDGRAELRPLGGPATAAVGNPDPAVALTHYLRALPRGDAWSRIPLHFDNDANLGALAELRVGGARGKRYVLVVHWERGIGLGLILAGNPYWGTRGLAGELGHSTVDSHDAAERPCSRCGRHCLEASVAELLADTRGPRDDPTSAIQAAKDGDRDSEEKLERAARLVGRALANHVNVLNPEQILINGNFGPDAYKRLVRPIQAELEAHAVLPAVEDVVVGLGALRDKAALHGAVWLALTRERTNYLLSAKHRYAQHKEAHSTGV